MEIPFNQVAVVGNEWEYTRSVVESGQIGGGGVFTRRCEELLEHVLGAPRVLLTTSGTHALELAAMLLEPEAVDEVILPSFTFVSTANAFRRAGARLVFADVQPDTLNLDAADVARKMTERTRCIVPVHYAGVGCELDELSELAEQSGARIIEDNAHGLLGSFKGRPLGTHGWMATLSFHSTKNFTCGEGGALVINDPAQIERAEILREKGTNRSQFFRGEVDKYTWLEVGSSYPPSEILSGVPAGPAGESRAYSEPSSGAVAALFFGSHRLGRAGRRKASQCAQSLRPSVPHVLHAPGDTGTTN